MKLNEVTEPGFYKMVNDTLPDIIYEVIPNTNERLLKLYPSCTLAMDEWSEGYIDAYGRRNYDAHGTLVALEYSYDYEVEKMNEKFIISGNSGSHLTEDKPTYKDRIELAQKLIEDAYYKINSGVFNNPEEVEFFLRDIDAILKGDYNG